MSSFKPYGLVVCGGNSSRMGTDKSMLIYHGWPQAYYVYHLLEPFCEQVYISCNTIQVSHMDRRYNILVDNQKYAERGPMAGLLSAFELFPDNNFLFVGCDYPLIGFEEIADFVKQIGDVPASAFYNTAADLYEPLLAYYSSSVLKMIQELAAENNFSLQQLLKKVNASKYIPLSGNSIKSIDTPEQFREILQTLKIAQV